MSPDDKPLVWLAGEVKTDAVVILDVFSKKTRAMPKNVAEACRTRLASYLQARK